MEQICNIHVLFEIYRLCQKFGSSIFLFILAKNHVQIMTLPADTTMGSCEAFFAGILVKLLRTVKGDLTS